MLAEFEISELIINKLTQVESQTAVRSGKKTTEILEKSIVIYQ